MSVTPPIVIVGAGPAGVSAAKTLVAAGEKPVLIDEGSFPGGQIFRRPPAPLRRSDKTLYGFDANRARRMRDEFAALLPMIDYRPETVVWGSEPGLLHLSEGGRMTTCHWRRIIVAAGAMDRIVPVKGWTAPGVFTLGAAQIALKAQAATIGRNVVLLGTGPLLYLVAYQYAKAGSRVAAVLETGRPFQEYGRLPALLSGGRVFARGLYYIGWLRLHGIRIETGVEPLEIETSADGRASGVRYRSLNRESRLSCDAVGLGSGLKPETQLADLLGVSFRFQRLYRQWLPAADREGRCTTGGVYLAGDGLAIRGSDVARLTGELAALALLADEGRGDPQRTSRLNRQVARTETFRHAVDAAFSIPEGQVAAIPGETVICRCEGLTAGAVRDAVAATGETDINRIKAFTRLGMGRCQGRICGLAACELVAAAGSVDMESVGRLRGQAPVKPITLGELAGGLR